MVRRVLIVAFCVFVATAPLADALCFAGCDAGQVSEPHHSCAKQSDDALAITVIPHPCPGAGETRLRSIDVRPTAAIAAVPPSTRFDPPLPAVRFPADPRSRATTFSAERLIPLRI